MPPLGNRLPGLTVVGAIAAIIEASIEDATIMVEFHCVTCQVLVSLYQQGRKN